MEIGIPQTIVTPKGTLTFNAYGTDYLRIADLQGADNPAIRRTIDPYSGRDGAFISGGFLDAIYPSFDVEIVQTTAPILQNRRVQADTLRAYLRSIISADGTWSWTPTGATARQRLCRAHILPDIRVASRLDKLNFALVCSDPTAYSTSLTNGNDTLPGGAAVNVTNSGDTNSYGIIRITGPVTNPTIKNNTSNESIIFTGLTIAALASVDVDTRTGRITLSTDGSSKAGGLDIVNSILFPIYPGVNALQFTAGTGTTGATKANAIFRSAWAG